MARFNWKELVGTLAPTLATAFGGPLAGAAVAAVSRAVLGKDDGTDEELAQVLATAKPEALAAIRKADQEFEAKMAELGIDLESIHQKDRESARQMRTATGDPIPGILAVAITLGFFGILTYLLVFGVPEHGGDALLIMLGALGAAWGSIINFFFGSSSGSKSKTDAMAGLVKK